MSTRRQVHPAFLVALAAALALTVVGAGLAATDIRQAFAAVPEDSENTRPQDGTNCEPAFVVENYAGVQGSLGMISAGHCDTPGKAVFGVAEDKDFEIVPLDVNKLSAPTVVGGRELTSANYFRAGNRNGDVFAGADRSATANPTEIGWAGGPVCRLGGVSPHQCGNIVREDYMPSYVNAARDFFLLDIPCIKGDSGAAVLSQDGTRAVGIVSGRRKADGACIVSRLDRVDAGMKLYRAPAADAKYQLLWLKDGKTYAIGVPNTRATCARVAESKKAADKGLDFRCVPV